jgi:hypothetical protein
MLSVNLNASGTYRVLKLSDDGSDIDELDIALTIRRRVMVSLETKTFRVLSSGPAEQARYDRIGIACNGAAASSLLVSESHDDGATWSGELSLATDDETSPPVYRFAVQRSKGVRIRMRTTYNGQSNPAQQLQAPSRLAGLTLYGYKLGRVTTGNQRG